MNFREQEILVIFGKHLKVLRAKYGFTQESLAYESDISLSQIARIETGRINPTLCTIVTIAKTLKIPASEMLDF